jgi:hypothetical protein
MRRLLESFARRAGRLRWMAVPLAAYLAVTAFLPLVHGAAARPGFARHIAWVAAGCTAVVALAFAAQTAWAAAAAVRELATRGRCDRSGGGE